MNVTQTDFSDTALYLCRAVGPLSLLASLLIVGNTTSNMR